jgi:hypothetical protein
MAAVTRISWEEFRDTKMLWFVNRILHTFGLAICVDLDEDDKIIDVFPARCTFRGFPETSEDAGFRGVTKYLEDNINELRREVGNK